MAVNTTGAAFFNVGGDFNAAPGSNGTITIDGGSYTNTYGDGAFNFNGSANAYVTGSLTLTNGANLLVTPSTPGNHNPFEVGASFDPGRNATGFLTIQSGSTLHIDNNAIIDPIGNRPLGGYNNLRIGSGDGGLGYATVTGTGSRLTTDGISAWIRVGNHGGVGNLVIEQGGFVGAFHMEVGRTNTSNGQPIPNVHSVGRVTVDGTGSELRTSSAYGTYNGTNYEAGSGASNFGRGENGHGYLYVTNGGTVNIENEYGVSNRAFFKVRAGYKLVRLWLSVRAELQHQREPNRQYRYRRQLRAIREAVCRSSWARQGNR